MPRVYKRKVGSRNYRNYTNERLEEALKDIRQNKLSIRLASEKYGIHRNTLWLKSKGKHNKPHGQQKVFTDQEENAFVFHIITMSDFGFPVTAFDLRCIVKCYLEQCGRKFFDHLEKELDGIPPGNIWNYDETNLVDDPGLKRVITRRGTKYPEKIRNASKRQDGTKAIIGDNLSSHLNIKVIQECEANNIRFIALPPNTTNLLQPLDVAYFRPMKMVWRKILDAWKESTRGSRYTTISKEEFPAILKTALDGLNKQYTVNGFRASGLLPWNPDALDYSKCLGKKTKIPQTSDTQMQLQCSETNCKEIVKLFDEALIKKLKGRSNQGCSTSNCENFNVLRKIYDILNSHKEKDETSIQSVFSEDEITNMPIVLLDYDETGRANHDELPNFVAHSTLSNLADEADLFSMDPQVTYSDCDIEVPNILTESELETINLSLHESGMNPNIQTETVTFSTESGYGQIGVNSPEKRLHFEESGSSACIGTFLNLPETPVRKGSRQTERVSFVISSSAYKKDLEVKNKLKKRKKKQRTRTKENACRRLRKWRRIRISKGRAPKTTKKLPAMNRLTLT
nr:unnamed protein product [Callosobruchus analis]